MMKFLHERGLLSKQQEIRWLVVLLNRPPLLQKNNNKLDYSSTDEINGYFLIEQEKQSTSIMISLVATNNESKTHDVKASK